MVQQNYFLTYIQQNFKSLNSFFPCSKNLCVIAKFQVQLYSYSLTYNSRNYKIRKFL